MTTGPGARISPGGDRFRADDGSADPAVAAALARWRSGVGAEREVLVALHASRLLVPVIAVLGERDEHGGDKSSEMALPKLIGNDGRPAIVAFTSTSALAGWRADARPVAAEAPRVWRAAVAEDAAVVIDVAGPVPFVLEGARLAALAAGQAPPPPHEDPELRQAIITAVADLPAITGFRLTPGDEPRGIDLRIHLTLSAADSPLKLAAERISARLAGRVRAVEITTELPRSHRIGVCSGGSRQANRMAPRWSRSVTACRPAYRSPPVTWHTRWPAGAPGTAGARG